MCTETQCPPCYNTLAGLRVLKSRGEVSVDLYMGLQWQKTCWCHCAALQSCDMHEFNGAKIRVGNCDTWLHHYHRCKNTDPWDVPIQGRYDLLLKKSGVLRKCAWSGSKLEIDGLCCIHRLSASQVFSRSFHYSEAQPGQANAKHRPRLTVMFIYLIYVKYRYCTSNRSS